MKTLLSAISITFVLTAQALASGSSAPAKAPVFEPGKPVQFLFDSKVPSKNVAIVTKDLQTLHTMKLSTTDQRTMNLFEMNSVDTVGMESWLAARAKVVVDENFDLEKQAYVAQQFYNFPNKDDLPTIEKATSDNPTDGKAVVAMLNIGGALYLGGKMQSVLLGMKLSDGSYFEMTTPRIGLLKAGEGLMSDHILVNKKNPDSIANSLARLSIYFHEARHSDGNGKSVVFAHAICPKGHDFAGYNACDRNLNGAYTMGAAALGVMSDNCPGCTVEELEALKLVKADFYNRVIKETPEETSNSSMDPALIHQMIDMYNMLLGMTKDPTEQAKYQDEIKKLQDQLTVDPTNAKMIPSTDWDARPEGV